jgi:hypothetical protein
VLDDDLLMQMLSELHTQEVSLIVRDLVLEEIIFVASWIDSCLSVAGGGLMDSTAARCYAVQVEVCPRTC